MRVSQLNRQANLIRKAILKMVIEAGGGHIAPALSIADIITVLYFDVLRIDPQNPTWQERDRFILSKGHACCALYATLAERGFFSTEMLQMFCKKDSLLSGHPELDINHGIEVSTGSLGHGLSIGAGMALAAKADDKAYRIFILLGDGECNEGSVWEAAMFGSYKKLDNLIAIVDRNSLQALGPTEDIVALEPLAEKWKAFGWAVKEIDGHDIRQIRRAFKRVPFKKYKPSMIIAHTIKGKGISFMENNAIWHFRAPNKEEAEQAFKELEIKE